MKTNKPNVSFTKTTKCWHPYPRVAGFRKTEPTSQYAKTQVQPGVHPPFYITNEGGELRLKLGV
jgi:hypothetical protein